MNSVAIDFVFFCDSSAGSGILYGQKFALSVSSYILFQVRGTSIHIMNSKLAAMKLTEETYRICANVCATPDTKASNCSESINIYY